REIELRVLVRSLQRVASLQVSELFGIDGQAVGLHRGRGRDRACDDLGLHQQALRAGIDQAGAELRQVENARNQREQASDIQRNNTAREAREGEREQELAGTLEPAQRPLPALQGRLFDDGIIQGQGRQSVLGIHSRIRLRSVKQSRPTRKIASSYPMRMSASARARALLSPASIKLP